MPVHERAPGKDKRLDLDEQAAADPEIALACLELREAVREKRRPAVEAG